MSLKKGDKVTYTKNDKTATGTISRVDEASLYGGPWVTVDWDGECGNLPFWLDESDVVLVPDLPDGGSRDAPEEIEESEFCICSHAKRNIEERYLVVNTFNFCTTCKKERL